MIQLIIPGFEKYFSDEDMEEIIYNPEKVVDHFEKKGFYYLEDLVEGWMEEKDENKIKPYIPYRIKLPSGLIIDEKELYKNLNKDKEFLEAFYYFHALYHEDIIHKQRFMTGLTFWDEADMKETVKKYSKSA